MTETLFRGIIQDMTNEELYSLVYDKYGTITRARGCFFYTKKGERLTDLFQENGRAVLGWDGKNAFTFFKNMMNKGLTGSFICEDKSRLDKAVSTLLASDRKCIFFAAKADALKAGFSISPQNTSVYRPWNSDSPEPQTIDCIILTPPLPWCDNLFILAVKAELQLQIKLTGQIKLPFAQETAITRAVYNLIAQLKARTETDWFIYDPVLTKYWTRKGPYLFPKISENRYDAFVKHCLECGIVINPSFNEPSIVPFGADKGVFTKLKNSPFEQGEL